MQPTEETKNETVGVSRRVILNVARSRSVSQYKSWRKNYGKFYIHDSTTTDFPIHMIWAVWVKARGFVKRGDQGDIFAGRSIRTPSWRRAVSQFANSACRLLHCESDNLRWSEVGILYSLSEPVQFLTTECAFFSSKCHFFRHSVSVRFLERYRTHPSPTWLMWDKLSKTTSAWPSTPASCRSFVFLSVYSDNLQDYRSDTHLLDYERISWSDNFCGYL